jgi:predicted RNase H-like HicB family nuclease
MGLKDLELNAVFQQTEQCWIAYIEELPGVNTQGKTLEEARANLDEALHEMLEINRSESHAKLEPGAVRERISLKAS